MDTSLERIRAKIAELEATLANLHIAERELEALEAHPAAAAKPMGKEPMRKARRVSKPKRTLKATDEPTPSAPGRQTIGAAITEALSEHGALAVGEIADRIIQTGRDINKRAVSFSLQALKKRGVVKSADGKWMLPKARAARARA
jgi:hypothetical protein